MVETYNKLVRDKIPEIIAKDNKTCITRILSKEEFLQALNAKLAEELQEYEESLDLSELADLQEVLNAIVEAQGLTKEEFEALRLKKRKSNGGFEKKIFLVSVNEKSF
jgi:predicted house-cleaning noncanonical NTP pyrophosphatase (MazG superfamily)